MTTGTALPWEPQPGVSRGRASAGRAAEILERISEGVIVLDDRFALQGANGAARRILGLSPTGTPLRLPSDSLLAVARRAAARGHAHDTLRLWFPERRIVEARAIRLDAGAVLVLLQDVTEEVLTHQIRREFVAHASHELKSPVAGLHTLAGAILEAVEAGDGHVATRFAHRLVHETERLNRLINDLLDLSKLEGPPAVAADPVDVSAVAAAEAEAAAARARDRGVVLEADVAPGLRVTATADHVAVLVRNLLDNAIRYTLEGGTVRLEAEAEPPEVVVRVKDTGIGIPLEAQSRIFERFYRVDRGRSRDRGGTGLGLAIVKHVAELHGGVVEVDSELGRGSTFTARFPGSPTGGAA